MDDQFNWKSASNADKLTAMSIAIWIENSIEFLQSFPIVKIISGAAEVPLCGGVYLFTNSQKETLYVGKAKNLSERICDRHHKIQKSIALGAEFVLIAPINYEHAWAAEQRLIFSLAPKLNSRVTKWWNWSPQLESFGLAAVPDGYSYMLERVLHGPVMRPLSPYEKIINPQASDERNCPTEWRVTRPRPEITQAARKWGCITVYSDGRIEKAEKTDVKKSLDLSRDHLRSLFGKLPLCENLGVVAIA